MPLYHLTASRKQFLKQMLILFVETRAFAERTLKTGQKFGKGK